MARRELKMEELEAVLYQWHKGRNISQISNSLGLDRKTIRKYLELAQAHGFTREVAIDSSGFMELSGKVQAALKTPVGYSETYKKTALYQVQIDKLLSKKYMTGKQAYRILKSDHGYLLSYSSFKRYIRIRYPKEPRSCLRLEVKAASEGQVDFGSAGQMYDPHMCQMRRVHAFVMTLSYSRLHYVEFVFDQSQSTWVKCHMNAFKFFGGVPERIILDNLKSGVMKPNTYDPILNKAYADCARHYGFIIDPAKIARGDHKGKVERKIPVVRGQFLSSYAFRDISDANEKVKDWCINGYGMEVHGTTKKRPYELFKEDELPLLKPVNPESFDIPLWKEAKVHPDHHIVFDKSYYSVATRYIGKKVMVRGGIGVVQIFYGGELIKTHLLSRQAGTFVTDEKDYPPEQSKYLLRTVSYYQQEALTHGHDVCDLVSQIMRENAYRNLRKIQGIFRLTKEYGSEAVNLTCQRCLFYEDYRMVTIKRILKNKSYKYPLEQEAARGQMVGGSDKFVRKGDYFKHSMEVA